nr:immunoglobulin heavy chain junction region [Mus musculus]
CARHYGHQFPHWYFDVW